MQYELHASNFHSGIVFLGDRFLCLKYWVTCWGSSAKTDLAKVSFGACKKSKHKHTMQSAYAMPERNIAH